MAILGSILKKAVDLGSKIPKRKNYASQQEKVLTKLLAKAEHTAFGEHFNFTKLLQEKNPIEQFQTTVSMYDYSSIYKQWWHRAHKGEPYVCWPGNIKYFALSSGTSEAASKYIPVTKELLSAFKKGSVRQLIAQSNYNLPKEKKKKVETTRNARNLLSGYYKKYSKRIFFQIKESDPFVNAVFVKYGWAITVHKAIGSSYNEIIIKGHRKENDGITNDSYFRWLYSGVTAGKIVNITSPKKIDPFMDCVFEDACINVVPLNSKQFLIFENYEVEIKFVDKVQSLENKNVIGAICEISKLLEQNGYLFELTKPVLVVQYI
jgi:hypothetical protein